MIVFFYHYLQGQNSDKFNIPMPASPGVRLKRLPNNGNHCQDEHMSSWIGSTFFVCIHWRSPNNIFFLQLKYHECYFVLVLFSKKKVLSGTLKYLLIKYFIDRLFLLFFVILSSNRMGLEG